MVNRRPHLHLQSVEMETKCTFYSYYKKRKRDLSKPELINTCMCMVAVISWTNFVHKLLLLLLNFIKYIIIYIFIWNWISIKYVWCNFEYCVRNNFVYNRGIIIVDISHGNRTSCEPLQLTVLLFVGHEKSGFRYYVVWTSCKAGGRIGYGLRYVRKNTVYGTIVRLTQLVYNVDAKYQVTHSILGSCKAGTDFYTYVW